MTSQTRQKHNKYSNFDLINLLDQLIFFKSWIIRIIDESFLIILQKKIIDLSLTKKKSVKISREVTMFFPNDAKPYLKSNNYLVSCGIQFQPLIVVIGQYFFFYKWGEKTLLHFLFLRFFDIMIRFWDKRISSQNSSLSSSNWLLCNICKLWRNN